MKSALLRCKVEPGMLPNERLVEVTAGERSFRFVVARDAVSNADSVRVFVVQEQPKTALVEIPGEPLSDGVRISVPKELLLEAR
jgi:hypothetical protein